MTHWLRCWRCPAPPARSAAAIDCSRFTGRNYSITAMSPIASGCSTPSADHSSRAWASKPSTTSASIAATSGGVRLTGHPTLGSPGTPPRRLDLVIQDVTPVESRSTADAANRMLDTTLGLRHGDRVLQSLMRIGQDYKKGTILLLRLQGLADFYSHHGYETGGVLLRSFAEGIEAEPAQCAGRDPHQPEQGTGAGAAGGRRVRGADPRYDRRSEHGGAIDAGCWRPPAAPSVADERLKLINTRIGMATWPRDGSSPDVILKAASLACDYFSMSEDGGPGTIMAAVVRAREQARLEYELHHAIERAAAAAALSAQAVATRWPHRRLRSAAALAA